jgi:hypothetical protein
LPLHVAGMLLPEIFISVTHWDSYSLAKCAKPQIYTKPCVVRDCSQN